MAPQRHPWSFMTQSSSKTVSTWASYLFCILSSVQLFLSALFLFSEGSTTLQWPLLVCFHTHLCLQPAFVLFAVCQPDCFPSCVLLLHVCDAMLVVVAKSVKQQAMTGRAQSHQLLLLCSHLLHVCVNKWACKHAVTLLRLCAPRWAQLWCSFRLTSGSSLIRKPLDWRTQTQPLKSGKRGERQVGCAVRIRAERAATLSHFLALFSN